VWWSIGLSIAATLVAVASVLVPGRRLRTTPTTSSTSRGEAVAVDVRSDGQGTSASEADAAESESSEPEAEESDPAAEEPEPAEPEDEPVEDEDEPEGGPSPSAGESATKPDASAP